ncbi:hypothetical protein AGMMS49975_09090 [Clostridia bacterium]|nr:hypothetical protein AGMMS49975_09090 [Clostridia bacterium]
MSEITAESGCPTDCRFECQTDCRFIPVGRYCEITGISYATVNYLLKTGQLNFIITENEQVEIDTQENGNTEIKTILEKLSNIEKMITALCDSLCDYIKLQVKYSEG